MVAIIPDNHNLSQEKMVNLKKYQADIIFCKGGHEIAISKVFQTYNIKLKESLTVQSAETLISMVKNDLGIGIISNFTLSSVSHNLIIKDISPSITREIGIITHSFNEVTPATRELIKIIVSSYNFDYVN